MSKFHEFGFWEEITASLYFNFPGAHTRFGLQQMYWLLKLRQNQSKLIHLGTLIYGIELHVLIFIYYLFQLEIILWCKLFYMYFKSDEEQITNLDN